MCIIKDRISFKILPKVDFITTGKFFTVLSPKLNRLINEIAKTLNVS